MTNKKHIPRVEQFDEYVYVHEKYGLGEESFHLS